MLNLVRDGNNVFTVNSPNTYTGTTLLDGGTTTLVDLGTLQGTSAVTVTQAALLWNDNGVQAVSNRLGAATSITLNGGGFQYPGPRRGRAPTPVSAISLPALKIGVGDSDVLDHPCLWQHPVR